MRNEFKVLIPLQTVATSAVFGEVRGTDRFTAARVFLACGIPTGTSPTMNVYIQGAFPQSAVGDVVGGNPTNQTLVWTDWISMTQLTATGKIIAFAVGSGNIVQALKDAALTAGNVDNGPVPSIIRAKVVLTGTTPSFPTVQCVIELIP